MNINEKELLKKYADGIPDNVWGIYAICIDNAVCGIEQSENIKKSVLQHLKQVSVAVNKVMHDNEVETKYKIITEAILLGYEVRFDILLPLGFSEDGKYYRYRFHANKLTLLNITEKDVEKYLDMYGRALITTNHPPLNYGGIETVEETLNNYYSPFIY